MKYSNYTQGDILLIKDVKTNLIYIQFIQDFTKKGDPSLQPYEHPLIDVSLIPLGGIGISDNPNSPHFNSPYIVLGAIGNTYDNDISGIVHHNIVAVYDHNKKVQQQDLFKIHNTIDPSLFSINTLDSYLPDDVYVSKTQSSVNEEIIPALDFDNILRNQTFRTIDTMPIYKNINQQLCFDIITYASNQNEPYKITVYSPNNQKQLIDAYISISELSNKQQSKVALLFSPIIYSLELNEDILFNNLTRNFNQKDVEELIDLNKKIQKSLNTPEAHVKRREELFRSKINTEQIKSLPFLTSIQIDFHEGKNDHSGHYYTFIEANEALKQIYSERTDTSDHKTYMNFNFSDKSKISTKLYIGDTIGALNPNKISMSDYISQKPGILQPNGTSLEIVEPFIKSLTSKTNPLQSKIRMSQLESMADQMNCKLTFNGKEPNFINSDDLRIYGLMDGTRTVAIGNKEEILEISKTYNFINQGEMVLKNYELILADTCTPYMLGEQVAFKNYISLAHDKSQLNNFTITIHTDKENLSSLLSFYNQMNKIADKKLNNQKENNNAINYERLMNQFLLKGDFKNFTTLLNDLSSDEKNQYLDSPSNAGGREGTLKVLEIENIHLDVIKNGIPESELNNPFEKDLDFIEAQKEAEEKGKSIDPMFEYMKETDLSQLKDINQLNQSAINSGINLPKEFYLNEFSVISDESISYQIRRFTLEKDNPANTSIYLAAITSTHSDRNISQEGLLKQLESGKLKIDNTHTKHYFSAYEQYDTLQTVMNPCVNTNDQLEAMNKILNRKNLDLQLFPQSKEFVLQNNAKAHPEKTVMLLHFLNDKEPAKSVSDFINSKNENSPPKPSNDHNKKNNNSNDLTL